MYTFTKDNRPKSPKEQAGNFIASMGGLMRAGPHETEIVGMLADLLTNIGILKNPVAVAAQCSRVLAEWADVCRANPDHAQNLALMGSKAAKTSIMRRRALLSQLPADEGARAKLRESAQLQANYEAERQSRRAIIPDIKTSDDTPLQPPRKPAPKPRGPR